LIATHIDTLTHIYTYTYTYTHTHTHTHIHTHMHTYINTNITANEKHTHAHTYAQTHTHTHTHTLTHAHIHTHVHTHTYTRNTHKHMYTGDRGSPGAYCLFRKVSQRCSTRKRSRRWQPERETSQDLDQHRRSAMKLRSWRAIGICMILILYEGLAYS
jgi:hypothetical protein